MARIPDDGSSAGYLEHVEASHLVTQAIPGAVIVHLKRELEAEAGAPQPARRMFIELSLGEAVQHWQHLGDLIRCAGAMQRQAAEADSSANL